MTTVEPRPVRVEIWSDPQCVWCFIAHPRFEKAVAAFEGEVEVAYQSFELRPDAPVEIDKAVQVDQHAGADPERIATINAQLARLAEAEGLNYRPELTQPTSSRLALELLHHAGETGRRGSLTTRLFTAYFTDGRHIGHIEELIDIAQEAGLDPDAARVALTTGRHRASVRQDGERLRTLGARGVPLYVVDGRWGISGAQPTQTYLETLERAASS